MTMISAAVSGITPLNEFVTEVTLQLPAPMDFEAGQYLQVVMAEQDKRPFSIANGPNQDGVLELHIGASEQNPYAMEVINKIKQEDSIEIELPLGTAQYRVTDKPVIIIAGGTGYSYARSILQFMLAQDKMPDTTLYWGAKTQPDLYEHNWLLQQSIAHPDFHYVPVLETPDTDWKGKTGLVHETVLEQVPVFSNQRVYVAGRFEMARVIKQCFIANGLRQTQLFGDAFAFID